VDQTNSNVFFSKHKSKSNPDPAKGIKTSLLILWEAAGARIKKIQNPVHAHQRLSLSGLPVGYPAR